VGQANKKTAAGKRADAVSIHEKARRVRSRAGETNQPLSGFACIQRKVVREKARFALADEEFDFWECVNKRIKRSHMIDVRVCQGHAPDGGAETIGHF
jgi:hypothetical protein